MIRDHFRVAQGGPLHGRGQIGRDRRPDTWAGGSGLAALLFSKLGFADRSWEDPEQPLIFTSGHSRDTSR